MKIPYLSDFRSYRVGDLKFDVSAGLTVAIVALPQSMAYALIAGLNPVYGLYTSIVAAIFGSLFGSSDHLITGPTNAISLMIAGQVRFFPQTDAHAVLFLLTFLVGLVQFLLGVLKVGKIINYVSHSVVVGFTTGAGVIIALGQLDQFLGIRISGGYRPLYEKVFLVLTSMGSVDPRALGLACFSVAAIAIGRKIHKYVPGALIGMVAGAAAVKAFGLEAHGVRLIGDVPAMLPRFHPPGGFDVSRAFSVFGGAAAIAIVGLVEAISIAKSISLSSGQRIDANREFRAQGLANMIAAFFRCFPSSGSFTRSAVNMSAGAKTRLAGMLSGIFVAVTLVFFAPYARYIPNASLAGVIVVVAFNMVNTHALGRIAKAGRNDLVVVLITVGSTILMPDLERAILVGIAVSVIVHLWNTGEVRVKLLVRDGSSSFKERDMDRVDPAGGGSGITLIHISGEMYFGSSSDLEEKLDKVVREIDPGTCIIRLKGVSVVDISAFEVVENFIDRLRAKDRKVLLCGVGPEMKRFLDRLGITGKIGEENVFMAEDEIFASTAKAFRKAEETAAAACGSGIPRGERA